MSQDVQEAEEHVRDAANPESRDRPSTVHEMHFAKRESDISIGCD
jgi:hypothetical protein